MTLIKTEKERRGAQDHNPERPCNEALLTVVISYGKDLESQIAEHVDTIGKGILKVEV